MNKPTIWQLAAVITEKGYNIDPAHFYEYYEDCCDKDGNWTVPDKPKTRKLMASWRGSLRTWNTNSKSTTHHMAIKQRDEAYTTNKKVYMKPIKKKPCNPRITELNKASFALTSSLRHMTLSGRIQARAKIKDIGRQIQVIKDNDNKVGEIIK